MKQFEPLIGDWRAEGEIPIEPPMKVSGEAKIERLGEFLVFKSSADPVEVPDAISIIGGAPDGQPQPMHHFDSRGVKRPLPDGPRRLQLEDLADARRGLERPSRAPASTSTSSARSRLTARRSRPAGSGAWARSATSGSSTSRSTTSAISNYFRN
ncbi:MAG: hypothetical protein M3P18_20060 [Actinomycetota bacterium]|nr:hypothetical protein [Actinomycetota bacterium]